MILVIMDARQRVVEHRQRFVKIDMVLVNIEGRFSWITFKARGGIQPCWQ